MDKVEWRWLIIVVSILSIIILTSIIRIILRRWHRLKHAWTKHKLDTSNPPPYDTADETIEEIIHQHLPENEQAQHEEQANEQQRDDCAQRVQRMCREFLNNPQNNWQTLLECADIYRTGDYPHYTHNNRIAHDLFQCASMAPDPHVAGVAQERCIELRDEPVRQEDTNPNAPVLQCPDVGTIKTVAMLNAGTGKINSPTMQRRRQNNQEPQQAQELEQLYVQREETPDFFHAFMRRHNQEQQNQRQHEQDRRRNVEIAVQNDKQNVHEHAVASTTASNLNRIADDQDPNRERNQKEIDKDIRNAIWAINQHPEIDNKKKTRAARVAQELTNNVHSKFNMNERQALSYVWRRINDKSNENNRANAIESLADELSSAIEGSHTVCPTGRISHCVQAVQPIDQKGDLEIARPKWALREEISNIAAKIQNRWSNDERYLNDEQETMDRVKQDFDNEVRSAYKNIGVSKKYLDDLIAEYKEEL